MDTHPFAPYHRPQYLLLTTFRKSGEPVSTPVWFVLFGGKIFVWTGETTGKVKRLRRNPQVNIAPCTFTGKPLGESISACARILSDIEIEPAIAAFVRKYGWQFRFIRWQNERRGAKHTIIEVSAN